MVRLVIYDRRDSLPFAPHTKPIHVGVEGQGEGGSDLGGKREMDLFYGYITFSDHVLQDLQDCYISDLHM